MSDATTDARWRRRKADRPGEIRTAALDLFAERGFAATRMEDIAERAGVTKGTVYLYFPTKEELFKAIVRAELLPNLELLEAAAAEKVPADKLLEKLLTAWGTGLIPARLALVPKVMMAEAGNFPELARFYLQEVIDRGRRVLRAVLRRGVEEGSFRSMDVESVSYCILAPFVFSVIWRHTFERHDMNPLDIPALARAHLDILLQGLMVSPRSIGGKHAGRRSKTKK
ncbi:TetR/AcrR family transcriptional regulator [Telmatocola sphagniphila]|uniref:TetR/AcrR family transcriptional regulator n=1 Tax=Telmatocola sphagniphila TaxID=1123043 RepID=A0A8E6B367_9BACT|nr:TetR/AcrR family transcriptional regulator [Telmatocola sphagniphila]QVL31335.1 TetR/AcrR family transcriptional regulator [Telmatocola sphagniphila]